jgi:hypothetical protein
MGSCPRGMNPLKNKLWIEIRGEPERERESKTEGNLGKDILEEVGKCGKTWSEFKRMAGNSQMEMLRKWPMLLM